MRFMPNIPPITYTSDDLICRNYFCIYLVLNIFLLFANSLCHWSCAICRPRSLMLTYFAARRLVSTCGFTPSVHFGSTNPVLHIYVEEENCTRIQLAKIGCARHLTLPVCSMICLKPLSLPS